ncbi:MAG: hypothetical protein IMY67_01910, partial [Bacteroidetes bacterium]|nr:hypothetical protein [Bacteroidota bacterium]
MKASTTFSILFWLKLSKAQNGEAPIYARITVNGKRVETTGRRFGKDCNVMGKILLSRMTCFVLLSAVEGSTHATTNLNA